MKKTKVMALVLCGTMLLSVSAASVAAEGGVSGIKAGKEKILTEISGSIKERTQEPVRKMSSLVKAAVAIAKTEEEARKAAEAAAVEAKAKQEAKAAEEKAKKEKAEAEKKAKEEAEKKKQEEAADTAVAAVETGYTETYYEPEPVYYAPDYSYYYAEPYYTEPVYDTLYADPVQTYEPVYEETYAAEVAYEDVVYTDTPAVEDTAGYTYDDVQTQAYDEALYTDAAETGYYDESSYAADAYAEEYSDEAYTEEASYGDEGVRATASDSDLDLLASIIYCEAGGESYEGQVAVGAVVLNRMESELYPDDMTDVIYQSGQFTPAMTGWLDQVRSSGVPDYCYDAAQAALNGENPVGDCLYFHAGGGDGLTIGNQTFY